MSDPSAPIALTAHLALVSSISFGGFPTVLPDVRNFVGTHGWMTNQEFANLFAMAQSTPRPNMILMMSFVGWKVWGFPGAVASAFATFGPPCTIYCATYRVWDRFRDAPWQRIVRLGLVPVVMGLVIASGIVMTRGRYQLAGRRRHDRRRRHHAGNTAQSDVDPAHRCRSRRFGLL
jgi:chromate transporter